MEQVKNEPTIYSAAVYCRLSKDDEQAGESISIGTLRSILTNFCAAHQYDIRQIYVDDGYSGLNFNRPGFQVLPGDVERGATEIWNGAEYKVLGSRIEDIGMILPGRGFVTNPGLQGNL